MRTIATSFLSIMQPLRTLTAFKVTSFDGVLLGFFGGDLFQSKSPFRSLKSILKHCRYSIIAEITNYKNPLGLMWHYQPLWE